MDSFSCIGSCRKKQGQNSEEISACGLEVVARDRWESSASYAPQLGLLVSQPSRPWIVLGIEGGGDRDRKSHLFTPCLDLVIQYLGHTSRARSSPHASEVYPFVLSEGASLTLVFEELEAVSTRSLRALARRQRATGW